MSLMLFQAAIIGAACASLGWLLSLASKRWSPGQSRLVDAIESKLPQTQCGQCEYPGCHAYAVAVAEGEAIDLCPPGGDSTLRELSELLNRELGAAQSDAPQGTSEAVTPRVAWVREAECVGCALCIPACPVDAVVGAQGYMHSVLDDQCTGCELCVVACPVDCIDMVDLPSDAKLPRVPKASMSLEPLGCIRCGRCDEVCPKDIPVRELWWSIRQGLSAELPGPGAEACIACGLCDASCPSNISLSAPILDQAGRDSHAEQQHLRSKEAAELYEVATQRRSLETAISEAKRKQRIRRMDLLHTNQSSDRDPS